MKKYLIALSALFASYTMSAQFTFGIDGGLSIPTGQYAGTVSTSNNTLNGYAKIGSCYDAYVGFKFLPFIGAMVQYGANNNSFDVAKLNTSGSSTFTTSGGDKIAEYLIGPYFSIKLANIKLEAKLLGGIVSSNYPTITESTSFNGVTNSVSNSFETGNDFGFCAGAKIKFMVAPIVGIGVGVDYLASSVTFKGATNSDTYKMSEGVIQATLGVSIDL
ncbi:MAG TPA: hypothetical protein VK809_11535 [Bacteroidia bacterium]|nr:hypothetical protein [Bacteroidia bacterium]